MLCYVMLCYVTLALTDHRSFTMVTLVSVSFYYNKNYRQNTLCQDTAIIHIKSTSLLAKEVGSKVDVKFATRLRQKNLTYWLSLAHSAQWFTINKLWIRNCTQQVAALLCPKRRQGCCKENMTPHRKYDSVNQYLLKRQSLRLFLKSASEVTT